MEQISSTRGRKGRFSLAISDGFVVQPSTRPMATPSLRSWTLAVSRKIFMTPPARAALGGSRALDANRSPGRHLLEHGGVAQDTAEHVDRTRGTDLLPAARGRPSEEDAERRSRRPVAERAQLHRLLRLLGLGLYGNAEIDLVAPGVAGDR